MYCVHNKATGAFEYLPSLLVNKLHLDIMFYEVMVHTQLFSGYVENELNYTNATVFIVDWLSYKWWIFGKNKTSNNKKKMNRVGSSRNSRNKSSSTISMLVNKKENHRNSSIHR